MQLHKRIIEIGTLSEPKGVPDPAYTLPSTVNWMRGLAIEVGKENIGSEFSKSFYSLTEKRTTTNEHEINTVFEQLLFALHQCSALRALRQVPCKADIARISIVSWYYGVYAAASAMIAAKDGAFHNTHAKTAIAWDSQISKNKLIAHPFNFRITTLIKKNAKKELESLPTVDSFDLATRPPQSSEEACAACRAYLSGSVNWLREKTEESIKSSKEFEKLGFNNFKTKAAQELRDKSLNNKTVSFLHQASRYRGKANYRDPIFLGLGGEKTETTLNTYIDDLSIVLDAFVCQAGIFCSQRLGKTTWKEFVTNLENEQAFSLSPSSIWGDT